MNVQEIVNVGTHYWIEGDGITKKRFINGAGEIEYSYDAETIPGPGPRHVRMRYINEITGQKLGWLDLRGVEPKGFVVGGKMYKDMFAYLGKCYGSDNSLTYRIGKRFQWVIMKRYIGITAVKNPNQIYALHRSYRRADGGHFEDAVWMLPDILKEKGITMGEVMIGWFLMERIRCMYWSNNPLIALSINDDTEIIAKRWNGVLGMVHSIPSFSFRRRRGPIVEWSLDDLKPRMRINKPLPDEPTVEEEIMIERNLVEQAAKHRAERIPIEDLVPLIGPNREPDQIAIMEYIAGMGVDGSDGNAIIAMADAIEARLKRELADDDEEEYPPARPRPRPNRRRASSAPRTPRFNPINPFDPFARAIPIAPTTPHTAGFDVTFARESRYYADSDRESDVEWPSDARTLHGSSSSSDTECSSGSTAADHSVIRSALKRYSTKEGKAQDAKQRSKHRRRPRSISIRVRGRKIQNRDKKDKKKHTRLFPLQGAAELLVQHIDRQCQDSLKAYVARRREVIQDRIVFI